jgi:hypothetical protein
MRWRHIDVRYQDINGLTHKKRRWAMTAKWFKYQLAEETYLALTESTIPETEKWNELKKSSLDQLIEGNARSDIIYEFYYQTVQ